MTNQPLTAEQIVNELIEAIATATPYRTVDKIEAYAAQQNAELVDSVKHKDIEFCKLVADYATLQPENERLKQQLAWQPISSFNKQESGMFTFGLWMTYIASPDYKRFLTWNGEWDADFEQLTVNNEEFEDYEIEAFDFFRPFDEPQPPKEAT